MLSCGSLAGQNPAFCAPLDIPLTVVGTFGELRPDHFHTGIDFTTKGLTGKNVYAVADGYVSRIKVSSAGYGKAIYVNHPGGLTSVYAHLDAFNIVVDDYIRRRQYEKRSFEIDIAPDEALFKVRKGDIIGYSGNSGASEGPHLHFELRNSRTEHPLNPLLYGIGAADRVGPLLKKIKIYPLDDIGVDGTSARSDYELIKKDSVFTIRNSDTIAVAGRFYIGLLAEDLNGSAETGLYRVSVFSDSTCVYAWQMDSLDFDRGRYINAFIDYPQYKQSGDRYVITRILTGNRLKIYTTKRSDGIFSWPDTLVHSITVIAADFAGNLSKLAFHVESKPCGALKKAPPKESGSTCYFGLKHKYETEAIIIDMPADVLYDSVIFSCTTKKKMTGSYSKTFSVIDKYTPVHSWFDISLKPDKDVDAGSKEKIVVAYVDGNTRSAVKTKCENGFYSARVKRFGDYCLMADSIPPTLKAINFSDNKNVSGQETLKVKITDDLSGIGSYNAYLNGQWILMEYDAKNDMLIYKKDEKAQAGKNDFLIEVTDVCGNRAVMKQALRF